MQVAILDAGGVAHVAAFIVLVPSVVGYIPFVEVVECSHIRGDAQAARSEHGVSHLEAGIDVGGTARVVALKGSALTVGGNVEDVVVAVGRLAKCHLGFCLEILVTSRESHVEHHAAAKVVAQLARGRFITHTGYHAVASLHSGDLRHLRGAKAAELTLDIVFPAAQGGLEASVACLLGYLS